MQHAGKPIQVVSHERLGPLVLQGVQSLLEPDACLRAVGARHPGVTSHHRTTRCPFVLAHALIAPSWMSSPSPLLGLEGSANPQVGDNLHREDSAARSWPTKQRTANGSAK